MPPAKSKRPIAKTAPSTQTATSKSSATSFKASGSPSRPKAAAVGSKVVAAAGTSSKVVAAAEHTAAPVSAPAPAPAPAHASLSEQLKKTKADSRDKFAGSSSNIVAARSAKYKAYLADGAQKSMSEDKHIKPSSHYEELAQQYAEKASRFEAHAADRETILAHFGRALSASRKGRLDTKAKEILVEWDKNKDGKLSMLEFRMQVSALGIAGDDAIDEQIFKPLDRDGNGFLDLHELKIGLKRALLDAQVAKESGKERREQAEALTRLAVDAREVGEWTAELEAEEANLREMRDAHGRTTEERLGIVLAKRNTHLGDLLNNDVNGDGLMDRKELRGFLHEVVTREKLEAIDEAEFEKMYSSVDKDANGTLDRDELKELLKLLQGAAAGAATDLTDQADLVSSMVKFVGKQQTKFEKAAAAVTGASSSIEEEIAAVS